MKKTITILCLFISALIYAQNKITKGYNGPTLSINNSAGTYLPGVYFIPGYDFGLNHKVVDVQVEIEWSKTDDSFSGLPNTGTGIAPDLSHVGFIMQGPDNITRYLAHSATTASSASVPTTASFAGSVDILHDTIVFKDRARSLLPATLPNIVTYRDTVSPNNDALSYYTGKTPQGFWKIGGIDDAPATGPALHIHSYLIHLTTSTMNVTGIATNQMVNENATLQPFSTINVTHFNSLNVSATITLDNNAKGVLTGTGLSGTGPYTIASTTAADLQAKLRALSFNPTDNRAATTDTTTFTVKINDGTEDFTNNKTTVISKAIKPIFENSTPSISAITPSGFALSTDINEAGTMYYVVVPEGATAPTTAEIKAGTGSGGSGQAASGTSSVNTGGFVDNFTITGLKGVTNYDVYVLAEDVGGATQLATKKVTTTAAPNNNILYVKKDGAGTQNGSSWTNAIDELAHALKWASTQNATVTNNLKIYVAGGTYKPLYRADNMSGANANDRDNAFVLINGVKLYGGFAGSENTLADRNLSLTANASILSGDIDNNDTVTNGISTTIAGNNAYHVVISVNDSNTTVLDGFTITGGNANNNSSITVETKMIYRNDGGGMNNFTSSPSITNSIFSGNTAGYYGGGMHNQKSSSPSITNTIFSGNTADYYGGGMSNLSSSPSITNTTFSGNTAYRGGGMRNSSSSSPKIYNSIFWNNKKGTATNVAGADIENTSTTTISHCLTQENSTSQGTNGINNQDPLFVNPANGDFRLQLGSPAINAGTNTPTGVTLPTTDKAGNPRIFDTTIDMGAYERQMKQQTITANNLSKTYGDADFTNGSASSNLALTYSSGNTAVATIVDNKIHITGAGTATITVSQTGNTTYDPAPNKDFTLTVSKKALTITGITASNKVYDGNTTATLSGTAMLSGVVTGETVTTSGGSATFDNKNVGTNKTVTVTGYTLSGADEGNYSVTQPTGLTADITKATLTATADDKSREYGEANPTFTISYSGFKNSDTVTDLDTAPTASTTATATTNVGTADITVSGGSDANYTITPANGTLTINKATLTATADNKSREYGEVNPTFTISYSGFKNSDSATDLDTAPTASTTATATTNVGTADITVSGGSDANYTITPTKGTLTINKATLTVTAENKTKVYDGAVFPTTAYSVTYNGFVNNEDESDLGGTLTFAGTSQTATNVGTHTITPNGLTSNNYDITFADGSLEITKKSLTITADSKEYDASKIATVKLSGYSGYYGTSQLSLTGGTATFSDKNAGLNKTVTATGYTLTGTLANNFSLTIPTTLTANIIAKEVEVSLTGTVNKVYDGTTQATLTTSNFTVTGMLASDTVTVSNTTGSYDTKDVGTSKTVTVNNITLDGSDSDNYYLKNSRLNIGTRTYYIQIDLNAQIGKITKATVTATAEDKTKTYDGSVFPTADYSVTYNGFVNNETESDLGGTLTFAGTSQTATNVGTHTITPNGLTSNNYDITFADGSLNITKATLTVTAEDKTKVYDGAILPTTEYSVTYNGFVNNEDESDLGGTLTFEGTSQTATNVGTHTITPNGLTSDNYDISFVDGSLNITKATLTVTAEDKTKVYDGVVFPTSEYSVTYNGFVNNETESDLGGTLTFAGTSQTATNAGTHTITPNGLTSSNYDISFVDGSLNITKASLTITAEDKTKVYDGAVFPTSEYSVTYNGFVNNEDESDLGGTLTFAGTSQTATNVGTHTITPNGLTSDNYDITFADGSLNITKATLTVTAEDKTKVYDGAILPTTEYSVTYNGFVNNEDESDLGGTLTFAGTSQTATNVGTHTITPNGLTSDNYDITFADGSLNITKASLTVTAEDKTKTYDGVVFPTTEYSVTYNGLVNNETESDLGGTLTFEGTSQTATNVGTHTITPNGLTSDNYDITFADGSLNITKADITDITFADATFDYDGTEKSIEISGVLPTDTSVSYTNNNQTDAGTYQVTANINGGTNYKNLELTANITINSNISGDTNNNGVIDDNEVAGDTNGNGVIDDNEIAGDVNGDGVINDNEIAGDINGNGVIDGNEVVGDTNGNGIIDGNEVLGDTNGDGVIDGNECSNEDRITRHWDDSLFFDNTGNEYTAWQWYKDGEAIAGATQQFYSANEALSGNYHVVATNKKGLAITMCPIYIDGNQTVVTLLQVYPNPVNQGNQFTVKANFETNLLQGAVITMYNLEGKLLQTLNQVSAENKLTAPNVSGLYIIRIILSNGKQKSTNLVVR